MTTTTWSTADAQTVKAWALRTDREVISDETQIGMLLSNGVIARKDDVNRKAGDQITYSFLRNLTNAGFVGDQVVTGSEQALTYDYDQISINQVRNAVSIPNDGTISAQRVTFNMPEDTYYALKNWMIQTQTLAVDNQFFKA